MKSQLNLFFTALMFYTRIPCPALVNHCEGNLNKATRFFPLIGYVVAGIFTGVYWLTKFLLPTELSLLAAMGISIMATGAFHEDGFADVCDGFGGGWTKQDILRIMKDSRVGTFAVAGLVLILLSKFFALTYLPPHLLLATVFTAHSTSRLAASSVIFLGNYAREDATSKVKPIGKSMRPHEFIVAAVTGIMPLMLYKSAWFLILMVPIAIATYSMYRFFNKWIGGYTGDCLGAVQQVTELLVYLGTLAICSYLQ